MITIISTSQKNVYTTGSTFEETQQDYGIQEITFRFDQEIIRFGSYEENNKQWQELLALSFDPPQEGSFRTISGNSVSYIFDHSVKQDLMIYYNTNLPAQITINNQPSIASPFLLQKEQFQIYYASQNDPQSPIVLSVNLPISLKKLSQAITISNTKGKTLAFRANYEVFTNTPFNQLSRIRTNYRSIQITPYNTKKHQDYTLIIDYKKLDSDKQNFTYQFSSCPSPQWLGLSQNTYIPNYGRDPDQELSFQVNSNFWLLHNTKIQNTNSSYSTLTISPEVPNLSYTVHNQGIKICGDFTGGNTYTLSFTPKNLKDIYKQKITSSYTTNFTMTSQKPSLYQVKGTLYIDRDKPIIPYQTINVTNVSITYQLVNSAYYTALTLYGRNIPVPTYKTNFQIESPIDQATWQEFDISHLLASNNTMIVSVNIQDADNPSKDTNFTKMLASSSSLTAHISSSDLLIQAKRLKNQAPLESMMISIWDPIRGSFQDLGRTKADGTLRIPNPQLPQVALEKAIFIGLFEERSLFNNIVFLSSESSYFQGINNSLYSTPSLFQNDITPEIKVLVSTDRPNYKLGEDVYIHAVARTKTNNQYSISNSFFNNLAQITILKPNQQEVSNFYKKWSPMGSFDTKINKEQLDAYGQYTIQIKQGAVLIRDYFYIEPLQPKTTEILFSSSRTNYRFGESLDITLQPKFLFGGNINSLLSYSIEGFSILFSSKKYPQYQFGNQKIIPYAQSIQLFSEGKKRTTINKPSISITDQLKTTEGYNYSLRLHAETKSSSAESALLENHSLSIYQPIQLGIDTKKTTVTNQEEITFNLITIDPITENILSNKQYTRFTITKNETFQLGFLSFLSNIFPIEQSYQKTVFQKNISTGNATVHYTPKKGGVYQVSYETYTNGTKISSSSSFIVLDDSQYAPNNMHLQIESDKTSYDSGEKACVHINNPFSMAQLFLIIERDTIREFYSLQITNTPIISHPVTLTYQDEPGVNVTAILSSLSEKTPSLLYGAISLPINPVNKKLLISVQTSKSNYLPQEEVEIHLSAYNNFNQRIEGEALVVVRDRAVLNSTEESIKDPILHFYQQRKPLFSTWSSAKSLLEIKQITNSTPNIPTPRFSQLAFAQELTDNSTLEIRSNFPYTIYYNGAVPLSKDQKTSISFRLPDNITSFDITVLAYDREQLFGKTNAEFTSSKQLMIEDILPSFLRPKDQLVWGAYIRNLSQESLNVVSTLNDNLSLLTQKITIPAQSSVFVSNSTIVNEQNTQWIIAAQSSKYQDIVLREIPIISENPWFYSSYSGILESQTNITINPQEQTQQSLQVQIANTPILSIKKPLQDLLHSESLSLDLISKRLLLFLAREDSLKPFLDITDTQLRRLLQNDIDHLNSYYNNDTRLSLTPYGSFYSTDPINFIQMYEILLSARQNNYTIDNALLNKLATITTRISKNNNNSIAQIYALNVLAANKLIDQDSFNSIYPQFPNTPPIQALILDTMYKLGFPLQEISQQTQKLSSQMTETSSSILLKDQSRFNTTAFIQYYGSYLDSIKILNDLNVDNIEHLFAFITFTIKYPNTESYQSLITANGKKYKLTTTNNSINIPINNNPLDLLLETSDNNPLFYNILYAYIPKVISNSIDSGYQIQKTLYENNQIISPDHLKLGQEYVVELTITSKNQGIQRLEIIDPLHAGFILKENRASSSYIPSDNKVYLYTSINNSSTITVRYPIISQYNGTWTAPPISVRLLNSPEVFGIQQQFNITIKP
ncbi:MAG: alpha-2-macroglobulin family protein [Brevinema sp.]